MLVVLIIFCNQKEVGLSSTNLQVLLKLGIIVTTVLREILSLKLFETIATNTFSLQRPSLQGNPGRNAACTGLSFQKRISIGLLAVGFFYLVTVL